ncbi:hypothetical protein J3Q09_14790 [Pseudomonas sp. R4-83]|uniref:hypothetical protein n=1 Tax=unclassified Pseudomonas TaxID=196821 RepID=UPI003DAA09BD
MPQRTRPTALPFTLDGVDASDPDGIVPQEILENGTIGRVPRWANFPQPPAPGDPADYTILYVFWEQNSEIIEIFKETYTYIDDKPEFVFSLTAEHMEKNGIASIYYCLEGRNGNPDPSPPRKLTIVHPPKPTLREPAFPDANINGYINCSTMPRVWEKIRVEIVPETAGIFEELDECVLVWQGFDCLGAGGAPLTPRYTFDKTIIGDESVKGFIIDIPFDPYIRPMVDNDSATASYTIFRRGVPVHVSHRGLVKIDRVRVGEPEPCGGYPLKDTL